MESFEKINEYGYETRTFPHPIYKYKRIFAYFDEEMLEFADLPYIEYAQLFFNKHHGKFKEMYHLHKNACHVRQEKEK